MIVERRFREATIWYPSPPRARLRMYHDTLSIPHVAAEATKGLVPSPLCCDMRRGECTLLFIPIASLRRVAARRWTTSPTE